MLMRDTKPLGCSLLGMFLIQESVSDIVIDFVQLFVDHSVETRQRKSLSELRQEAVVVSGSVEQKCWF